MPRPLRSRSPKFRFLLDENVPAAIQKKLASFDTLWVGRDLILKKDLQIYNLAIREQRILLTLDRDFCQLRIFQRACPTIILLKFNPQLPDLMAVRVDFLVQNFETDFFGKLLILSADELLIYP